MDIASVSPAGATWRRQYSEGWTRGDGKMEADILHVDPGMRLGKGMYPGMLEKFPVNGRTLAANSPLPTDPDALLKWAETPTYAELHPKPKPPIPRKALAGRPVQAMPPILGTPASRAAQALQGLLASRPPAKLAAAAFKALAKIPGVTAQRDAVDALGRHGVAFAIVESGGRFEVIVDPTTYRYLGWADVLLPGTYMGGLKAGSIESASALITDAIVDNAGQRPRP